MRQLKAGGEESQPRGSSTRPSPESWGGHTAAHCARCPSTAGWPKREVVVKWLGVIPITFVTTRVPCGSTTTRDGNSLGSGMPLAATASPELSFRAPWRLTTPWSAEEMLDGQHRRMDVPANARTAYNGLLLKKTGRESLLNRLSCLLPPPPPTKRPNRSKD